MMAFAGKCENTFKPKSSSDQKTSPIQKEMDSDFQSDPFYQLIRMQYSINEKFHSTMNDYLNQKKNEFISSNELIRVSSELLEKALKEVFSKFNQINLNFKSDGTLSQTYIYDLLKTQLLQKEIIENLNNFTEDLHFRFISNLNNYFFYSRLKRPEISKLETYKKIDTALIYIQEIREGLKSNIISKEELQKDKGKYEFRYDLTGLNKNEIIFESDGKSFDIEIQLSVSEIRTETDKVLNENQSLLKSALSGFEVKSPKHLNPENESERAIASYIVQANDLKIEKMFTENFMNSFTQKWNQLDHTSEIQTKDIYEISHKATLKNVSDIWSPQTLKILMKERFLLYALYQTYPENIKTNHSNPSDLKQLATNMNKHFLNQVEMILIMSQLNKQNPNITNSELKSKVNYAMNSIQEIRHLIKNGLLTTKDFQSDTKNHIDLTSIGLTEKDILIKSRENHFIINTKTRTANIKNHIQTILENQIRELNTQISALENKYNMLVDTN